MNEPLEPSPFAAFAMPKRNAVEEFAERQRRAAQTRRTMIGCVLSCLVGAVGGAASSAAFEGDLETVLAAIVGSLAGAFLGVPAGFVLGGICFSVMSLSGTRGRPTTESEIARKDPMATMRDLMFAWCLIGVAIGAAIGALLGAQAGGAIVLQQSLARRTMIGSLVGSGFAMAVWFYLQWSVARKPAEPA